MKKKRLASLIETEKDVISAVILKAAQTTPKFFLIDEAKTF